MHRYSATEANDVMAGRWRRLWLVKTGREERPDLTHNFKVQLGRRTEAFNLDWLTSSKGARVVPFARVLDDGLLGALPPDAWLEQREGREAYLRRGRFSARPDAIGFDAGGAFLVEAKHVGARSTPEDVVRGYLGQLHVTMHTAGLNRAVLSVIYGSDRLAAYGVDWQEDFWRGLQGWLDVFEGHLTLDVEPIDPDEPPAWASPACWNNRWRPIAAVPALQVKGKRPSASSEEGSECFTA